MGKKKELSFEEQLPPLPVIPMGDIIDEIRMLAVIWGESFNMGIRDTHKLASDMQNIFNHLNSKR